MTLTSTRALIAAAALACGGAVALKAAPAPGPATAQAAQPAPPHPKVEAAQDCETCHLEKTPAIVKAWEKSPHGLNAVKCFVCHGSLDDSAFTTRPTMAKCDSCHAEQVATMKTGALFKDKTCFTCHDAHALNPHAAAQGGKQ